MNRLRSLLDGQIILVIQVVLERSLTRYEADLVLGLKLSDVSWIAREFFGSL